MTTCKECDGTSFTCIAGNYFCSECHIQIQDYHEVDFDENYSTLNQSQHRYTKTSNIKEIIPRIDSGIPWTYPEAYAIIINKQVAFLTKTRINLLLPIITTNLFKIYFQSLGIAFSSNTHLHPNFRFRDIFQNIDPKFIKKLKCHKFQIPNVPKDNPANKDLTSQLSQFSVILDKYDITDKANIDAKNMEIIDKTKCPDLFFESNIRPGLTLSDVKQYFDFNSQKKLISDSQLKNFKKRRKCLVTENINKPSNEINTSYPLVEIAGRADSMISFYQNCYQGTLKQGFLTILSTLSFTYMGCMLCTTNVLISDLIRLVSQKKLPYFGNTFKTLPATMKFTFFDNCILNSRTVPMAKSLRLQIAKLYKDITLPINVLTINPAFSASKISTNYIFDLFLTMCERFDMPGIIKNIIADALVPSFAKLYNGVDLENLKTFSFSMINPSFLIDDPPYNKFKEHNLFVNWEGKAWALLITSFEVYLYLYDTCLKSLSIQTTINNEFNNWFDTWLSIAKTKYFQDINTQYKDDVQLLSKFNFLLPNLPTTTASQKLCNPVITSLDSILNKYTTPPVQEETNFEVDYINNDNSFNPVVLSRNLNYDKTPTNSLNKPSTSSHLDFMYKPWIIRAMPFECQVNSCLRAAKFMAYRSKQSGQVVNEETPYGVCRANSITVLGNRERVSKQSKITHKLKSIFENFGDNNGKTGENEDDYNFMNPTSSERISLVDPLSEFLTSDKFSRANILSFVSESLTRKKPIYENIDDLIKLCESDETLCTRFKSNTFKQLKKISKSLNLGLERYVQKLRALNLTWASKSINLNDSSIFFDPLDFIFAAKAVKHTIKDRKFQKDFSHFTSFVQTISNTAHQWTFSKFDSTLFHYTHIFRLINLATELSYLKFEELLFEICLLDFLIFKHAKD